MFRYYCRRSFHPFVIRTKTSRILVGPLTSINTHDDKKPTTQKVEIVEQAIDQPSRWPGSSSLKSQFYKTFFPANYPSSVTSPYRNFVTWQFLQAVSGTMTGVLATQSLLHALSMPVSTSLPIAASLNWVIKDGLGLLGGVVYTSMTSNKFDADPKRYRWRAVVALQVASLCELLTPLVPAWFLLLASVSNVGKNMAWLALSGCRAQMHQSFCLRQNLGDVTAKSGSQGTAAGLVGTGLGIAFSALFGSSLDVNLYAFFPLSLISLYGVYRSNAVVVTNSLNNQRAEILFHHYFKHKEILSPSQVAEQETFIGPSRKIFSIPLEQPSLTTSDVLEKSQFVFDERQPIYFLSSFSSSVKLWFVQSSSPRDITQGFFHACRTRYDGNEVPVEVIRGEFDQLWDEMYRVGWRFESVFLNQAEAVCVETAGKS